MMNPLKAFAGLFSKTDEEEIEEPRDIVFWVAINPDEATTDIHIPDNAENTAEIIYYLIKNLATGHFVGDVIQLIMDKKEELTAENRQEISKAMTYILADPVLVTDESEEELQEDDPIIKPSDVFNEDEE